MAEQIAGGVVVGDAVQVYGRFPGDPEMSVMRYKIQYNRRLLLASKMIVDNPTIISHDGGENKMIIGRGAPFLS